MKRYEIGSVEFRKGRKWVNAVGDERVALLRALYREEPLPEGVLPWVWGYGQITSENVDWETAGERVTR